MITSGSGQENSIGARNGVSGYSSFEFRAGERVISDQRSVSAKS